MATKRIEREPKKLLYAICPLCGMNRVMEKKGSRAIMEKSPKYGMKLAGRIVFGAIDVSVDPFEDTRQAVGGNTGFIRVGTRTFEEVIHLPEYADFKEQIRQQCLEILSVIGYSGETVIKKTAPIPAPILKPIEVIKPVTIPISEEAKSYKKLIEYFKPIIKKNFMLSSDFEERFSGFSIILPNKEKITTEGINMKELYKDIQPLIPTVKRITLN